MPGYVDLHLHTTASDGVLTPAQLLDEVRSKELVAFSIADHDTLDGYREASGLLTDTDPELVPGLELSVAADDDDMHMLAYLFDPDHDELASALARFCKERNQRGHRMVERLNEQGLDLSFDAVVQAAAGAAVGRPHIAEAMLAEGLVSSFEEAFRKYIGNRCPAYIPKSIIGPKETIDLIHRARGVAVLAHPFINDMHRHVEMLAGLRLDGLEVSHYSHSRQKVQELKRLAKRHGLLLSGGSDFHGRQEHEGEIGADQVPVEYLDKLKDRAQEIRGTC